MSGNVYVFYVPPLNINPLNGTHHPPLIKMPTVMDYVKLLDSTALDHNLPSGAMENCVPLLGSFWYCAVSVWQQ